MPPRHFALPARRIFAILVLAAGASLLLGAAIAARSFYYVAADVGGRGPDSPILRHPEQTGIAGLTEVTLTSRDDIRLRGWYAPSRNGAAVVVSTGTDANRSSMLPEIRLLSAAGFGVLAFDWPGSGLSEGKIDWGRGATAALEGAIDWLARRADVNSRRIGALGFSAGGAVTVRVAAEDARVRAMVLTATSSAGDESSSWIPMTRHPFKVLGAEWAARYYGWPVGRARPMDLAARLAPRPVFIVGGSDDPEATPLRCRQLFDAAREPKTLWIVPGATHGDFATAAPTLYVRRVSEFFRDALLKD